MKKIAILEAKVPVVLSGHPWIFSGAIAYKDPSITPGDIVEVVSEKGEFLAIGIMHPDQSLALRILSYKKEPIETLLRRRLLEAYTLRETSGLFDITNAYRLVNAEGDRLGGLIVDVYNKVAVIQIATIGMERLKSMLVALLIELFGFEGVYERSDSSSRSQEGLEPISECLYGQIPDKVSIFEGEIQLQVDVACGQKTGYFLDQRPMRLHLATFAKDKKVLNLFSYTGGFSLQALSLQAKHVISVDVDRKALRLLDTCIELNDLDKRAHTSVAQDVFAFLDQTLQFDFDLVIVDPPAFAKKRQDIEPASKGYKRLFKAVLSKIKEGAFLYVASCSYFMDEKLFEKPLLQAAMETRTCLKLLSPQLEAIDHPRLLAHKEGTYLKGFFVQVFRS